MDHHVKEYYHQSSDGATQGNFHAVIALHERLDISWESLCSLIPQICRGWFELAHLSIKDRIEFTRDFWLTKFPYREGVDSFLNRFFASLDDIGIFISQKKFEDPYEVHLVYSLKDNGGFFRGCLPALEKDLIDLQKKFSPYILPSDYLAFLQIHDGFCKATDCTGIISSSHMPLVYENFQNLIGSSEMRTSQDNLVNPKTLIPFYESFGMPFFQCFWAEWYPEQEMGNVYFSSESSTISDIHNLAASSESMAFPVFIDWLMFYLERVE